ncbi:MAG TPA: sigma-54 dependent transcriptional regulator [Candidatus Hydrogenedentes bacterium]|nr:sigma-54 dependent transcriptional regulator [Candidatus Hydrogenedentota bacterium]
MILIVEDDRVQREILADILRDDGHQTMEAADAESALEILKTQDVSLLLTDLKLPGMDGIDLLRETRRLNPDIEVIIMTAHGTVKTAVSAMREGAADYLEKPFDKDELCLVVDRALEKAELRRQNRDLRELVSRETALGNIIGQCPAMREVFERVRRAVTVNSTVLILGESGTGKELVARHIHFSGSRRNKPFVVVNCAAIPEHLVESELFGHEKGAFTGAETSRPGKFELAHGGTLFLDEIGDMRLESQTKLLRALQDGTIERVGASKPRQVDVRVIAATNCNLARRVADGQFRRDLYYRLEVLTISLPPLRDRVEDLPLLISHLREKIARKLRIDPPEITPDVMDAFRRYRWPGNVRELEHTLEQVFVLCRDGRITRADLPEKFREQVPQTGGFRLPPGGLVLEDLEEDLIRQALERSGGRIKEAAELLGLTYKTLQYRLKKHDIDRRDPRPENDTDPS